MPIRMRKGTGLVSISGIMLVLSLWSKSFTVRTMKKMTDATRENTLLIDTIREPRCPSRKRFCTGLPVSLILKNVQLWILLSMMCVKMMYLHKVVFTVIFEWFNDLPGLHRFIRYGPDFPDATRQCAINFRELANLGECVREHTLSRAKDEPSDASRKTCFSKRENA